MHEFESDALSQFCLVASTSLTFRAAEYAMEIMIMTALPFKLSHININVYPVISLERDD